MAINQQYRRNVRTFYAWLGSIVLLAATPLAALQLIDRETPTWRALAVVVGVGGMLPWMWVVFTIVRRGDEVVRRMHLVAIAIAAAATLLVLVTLDWLQRAWFIRTPDFMFIWPACLLLWLIALIGTKRYYERQA